jgi:hypothetical protein
MTDLDDADLTSKMCRGRASSRAQTAALALSAVALVAACGRKAPAAAPGPARSLSSDARTREHVGVTIYNQNFGLVREQRTC